jgi:hypothetical protein
MHAILESAVGIFPAPVFWQVSVTRQYPPATSYASGKYCARRANHQIPVHPLLQKYFSSILTQISSLSLAVPSHRGALRNVINAERDAVDAGSMLDESC